jgi:hypothetical protein
MNIPISYVLMWFTQKSILRKFRHCGEERDP